MQDTFADAIAECIRRFAGSAGDLVSLTETAGGSISRALLAETADGRWFVKLNQASRIGMFEAETDGLRALARCPELRVPQVAGLGVSNEYAFLVLEYVAMRPLRKNDTASGTSLAALHRITGAGYGWHRDNFIGSTPQSNRGHDDWPTFFARERLLPQLDFARRNGGSTRLIDKGERLANTLNAFFTTRKPEASLLHGDLWGGNAAVDSEGRLVLFDPAVYFGDREADLAMTELFGGFPPRFYAAYREAWPLDDGYPQRRTLYNLYHVLNHFNLFGGGYATQAERMIETLLAEI